MTEMSFVDGVGFASNLVSLVLGIVALVLSVMFYVAGRGTEQRVATSLAKIETETQMLQKITGRQVDRLTRFATERPVVDPVRPADLVLQLIEVAQPLMAMVQRPQQPDLRPALVNCHIALYYYSALTNYWAQTFLPGREAFDTTDETHVLAKRAVDTSYADFSHVAQVLEEDGDEALRTSQFINLLRETQTIWRTAVRDAESAWLNREAATDTQG